MNLTQIQIKEIKDKFDKLRTIEDFLNLLNIINILISPDKPSIFTLQQLYLYSKHQGKNKYYRAFKVQKKSGSFRTIHSPNNHLKLIQKTLNIVLHCVFKPEEPITGFVCGKSIIDNAKYHEQSRYVYNIDLKDFFPSIDQARFWKCLQLEPFNLNGGKVEIANVIAEICCCKMIVERIKNHSEFEVVERNALPQGAPTSPTITNIVCQKLDKRLLGIARRFGLKFSRYADDITFSSMHNVYTNNDEFTKELQKVIEGQGFQINSKKTRLQKDGYRKEVTGLLVNEKVNIQKRYIKQLRMWLYFWERYGYNTAYNFFLQSYSNDKGHTKNNQPNFENVIFGKLNFLRMVKGKENLMYLKLKSRFQDLNENNKFKHDPKEHLKRVLELLLEEGLEIAMDYYKPKTNLN